MKLFGLTIKKSTLLACAAGLIAGALVRPAYGGFWAFISACLAGVVVGVREALWPLAKGLLMIRGMKKMGRPALRLVTASEPGFSKVGGLPNLPEGTPWPFWKERPLSFIAQLDLAELKVAETLPEMPAEGRLYFFYPAWWADEWGQPWGDKPKHRGSLKVVYSLEAPGPKAEAPEELNQPGLFLIEDETGIYSERFLRAVPAESFPAPFFFAHIFDRTYGESVWKTLYPLVYKAYDKHMTPYWEASSGLRHQMGGWSIPEQLDDMDLQCQLASNGIAITYGAPDDVDPEVADGAADWQLLLQLDSDPGDEKFSDQGDYMAWGAEGLIYFWIRKQDLARRNFNNMWAILQCT